MLSVETIYEHLDSDQELCIEVEDYTGMPLHIYLTYQDYLKIKKAFEEYKKVA